MNQNPSKALSPVIVGLAMFLFFPVGLYLLWRHPMLGKNRTWWGMGIAWACMVMLMGSMEDPQEQKPSVSHQQEEAASQPRSWSEKGGTNGGSGKTFPDKEMENLYRKAFSLRLGMSENDVFRIMGSPTKREAFNPANHVLPGLPVIDPRPLDTSTWSSASDPGSGFIMVTIMEGRVVDINAHKKDGSILRQSEILDK